ncbi:hypothetical protein Tco_1477769, partial [Tanacetum coccineum]
MTTLAEHMIVVGAENRPPMLDKTMYNSWQSRLPPDVYSLVNHCKAAKDIWDRVKLLMQGTKLSYQERECKLYNEFDKFTLVKGDDLIAYLNKAMTFMSTVMALRFPSTNNQLRTSSNPRNQATIQDGRVSVQQVKGRQSQSFATMGTMGNVMSSKGNITAGQGILHGSKEKMLLVQAQESGQVLDEEQIAFLAHLGVVDVQVTQIIILLNVAFQT